MKDSKNNNFLHLLSKNFIYKSGDQAHPNYEFIISPKLDRFCEDVEGGHVKCLQDLLIEENFDGISPMKMALDNDQYDFIRILCKAKIIDKINSKYDDDVISHILRLAIAATDYKIDFEPKVILFRDHFEK